MKTRSMTSVQKAYLQQVCLLLCLQLALMLTIVWMVHTFFPDRTCLLTCQRWLDLLSYLLLAILLIYVSHSSSFTRPVRYTAFYGLAILLAYVVALQYNIQQKLNQHDKKVATRFLKAVVLVIMIFIINIILLPFLLPHMGLIYLLSFSFFIALVGLIVWGFFVGKEYLTWVSVGLFVFLGLLLTDLTVLVSRCKKPSSPECDPLEGASLLYVDLINLVQQIFILMNDRHG